MPVGVDSVGLTVVYSCPGRSLNKGVEHIVEHICLTFEHVLNRNVSPCKILWIIDFAGFSMADCKVRMATAALQLLGAHYPERLGQVVMVCPL